MAYRREIINEGRSVQLPATKPRVKPNRGEVPHIVVVGGGVWDLHDFVWHFDESGVVARVADFSGSGRHGERDHSRDAGAVADSR